MPVGEGILTLSVLAAALQAMAAMLAWRPGIGKVWALGPRGLAAGQGGPER